MSITIKCDDGDWVVDAAGRYVTVQGLEKGTQDIAEALLNTYDPKFPTYYNGSTLWTIQEKTTALVDFSIESLIHVSVTDAIDRLRDIQDNNAYVDDDERINKIAELFVRHPYPMTWIYYLRVITDSDQAIPLNFPISLRQQIPENIGAYDTAFMPEGINTEAGPFL